MQIGLTNLDKFAHVGAFSGFRIPGGDIKTAFDGVWADPEAFNNRIETFYISVGTKENVEGAREFHTALKDAGIKHEYFESEGTAHEWQTWRRSLHGFAPLLFQTRLTNAAPAHETAATSAAAPAIAAEVIRIKAGLFTQFTDSNGNKWSPDQGFKGGATIDRDPETRIEGTEDPGLYLSEHYAMDSFSYKLPNGKYVAKLHFAETFEGITGPGQRVFSYNVQGREFKDLDIWVKAGGANRAYIETVPVEVTDGEFRIDFISQIENPEINAIEIFPQSAAGDGTAASAATSNTSSDAPATGAAPAADKSTLKAAFKEHFYIGVAVNRAITTGAAVPANNVNRNMEQVEKDIELAKLQFNQITPENDLKWALVHPREGADGYDFGPADAFVNFGAGNDMYLIGHTLVWHAQTPDWVFAGTNPPPQDAETTSSSATSTSTDGSKTSERARTRRGEVSAHVAMMVRALSR